MDESTILDALVNPSLQHWMALAFGQWIYALTGANTAIISPVSALMIILAAMNVVVIIAFIVMMAFFGGRAIFSGGATASVVSTTSPYMALRVILALAIIMPTTYGISQLDQHSVSISNGQVGIVQGALWGSGVGDAFWLLSGKSLVQYGITSNTMVRNTVAKTHKFAKTFVCNEFFYKNVGSTSGMSRFYYRISGEGGDDLLRGVDSLTSIPLPASVLSDDTAVTIHFGGNEQYCGSITVEYFPQNIASSGLVRAIATDMFQGMSALKAQVNNQALNRFISELSNFDTFAQRYYSSFAKLSYEDVVATSSDKTGTNNINLMRTVNVGSLQSGSDGVIENEVARATDALNYLALRLSYFEKSEGENASKQLMTQLSGALEPSSDHGLTEFGNLVFDKFLGGWVSAGMYWSVFQSLSDILNGVERTVNSIQIQKDDISDARLCQNSNILARSYDTVRKLFNENNYLCESAGHVMAGFDVILAHAAKKGQNSATLPNSLSINSDTYPIDKAVWSSYFVVSPQTREHQGYLTPALFSIVDGVWGVSNFLNAGTSGVLMGSDSIDRSLLSGDDAIMLDLGGTTSPYVLLNRLGENTRDLALMVKFGQLLLKSSTETFKKHQEARVTGQATVTAGKSTLVSWLWEMPLTILFNGMEEVVATLGQLYGALITASLIAMYGVPMIPTVGWVFIIIGVLYTIITATGSIPFTALLMGIPKGDGVFAPDTERVLSLVFGVFVRQSLIVLGFVVSLVLGYVGLSILNFIWITTFINKLSSAGVIDNVLSIIVFFVGYVVCAFYICLYTFRVISMMVDHVGVWFSTHLTGGAYGSNHEDFAAAQGGLVKLSNQLDELTSRQRPSENKEKKKSSNNATPSEAEDPSTKAKTTSRTNA
ncbi:hypothetical protein M2G93_16735 [Vibrio vulnificus]|uniref:hypothetical protein n=1 Tax=Vibrio TaxID=662 RepID=UPI000B1DA221|nr:hypothetical protein [Vibrio parahaemolyticus]EGQ9239488.1 hypothetical protein [Vibrio vulnificus]EHD1698130.1 hypothetical protein [Vibrio vulnificus]EKZ9225859.1 hypothetical protein [Vibrio vulnificus]ELC9582701.1 hypothetical protein [Vibrio vulnificus]MCU8149762.1 hypothetical protein [Vibrio vulnificus]